MAAFLAFALACADPAPLDDAPLDTAEDSQPEADLRCPEGMALVDAEAPWCIDRYEAVFEGDPGSADQGAPDARPLQGLARAAAPGELPTFGLSFDQARAACAATPALDEAGEARGLKRLARSWEWEDAGDGQPGEGGLTYPYGDAWDPSACVTRDDAAPWDGVQPAGTRPACVSPFGVVDLIGNLWEWADPEQDLDLATALDLAEGEGLRVTEDGGLWLSGSLDRRVRLDVAGVYPGVLAQDEDGRLYVEGAESWSWPWDDRPARGFLILEQLRPEVEAWRWLPVSIAPAGALPGPAAITLEWASDGAPLTDKRGCAYYAGDGPGCPLSATYHGHVHDFDGSIGFRCAADPF